MAGTESELDELIGSAFRFAFALEHDHSRAEDLVQEAFCSVLRAKGPWTKGYVFAAVRSRFVDRCRSEIRSPVDTAHDCAEIEEIADRSPADTPFELENGRLDKALAALRPEERASLELSAVEGLSTRQIAELFDKPRGTVLSLMHRARVKMRRMLTEDEC